MRKLFLVIIGVLAIVLLGACGIAGIGAPAYPSKSITWVVPYNPGQGPDLASRYLAEQLEKDLGQKIVVENQSGGGTVIAFSQVASSKPDGYTIGFVSPWAVSYLPMIQDTPFKSGDDFTPIVGFHQSNGILVVKADAPWKTLQDLMDDAKKRPGKISFAVTAGLKGLGHVEALSIAKWGGGVQFNIVPVNSAPTPDILGGTIDVGLESTGVAIPQIQTGKLRALMVNLPLKELPDVPTPESLKMYVIIGSGAVMGPKGLPADVTAKLSTSLKKIIETDAFVQFETKLGYKVVYTSPEDLVKRMQSDAAALKAVASEQGWLLTK